MDHLPALDLETACRAHVGLEVRDLERSIAFYRALFGVAPVKLRPGYAKFEPDEPPLVLSLSAGRGGPRHPATWHFGIRVSSTAGVRAAQERLRAAGLSTRVEEGTECCYALQDKVWVDDPDGHPWEVYTVLDTDVPAPTPARGACCAAEGSPPC